MRTSIISLIFILTLICTEESKASDLWTFRGTYQNSEIKIIIETEMSDNWSPHGSSSSKDISCQASYDSGKINNPVIIYNKKTYALKKFVTSKDNIVMTAGKSLDLFDFELKYSINGKKGEFRKKFTAFTGTYRGVGFGKLYIIENGKKNLNDFEKVIVSRLKWKKLVLKKGEKYSYVVEGRNSKGQRAVTVLRVKYGNVYRREYRDYRRDKKAMQYKEVFGKSWVENEVQLASHSEGAEVKTIDQLYDNCEKFISEKKSGDTSNVIFSRNGLIFRCEVYNSAKGKGSKNQSVKINYMTF
ncbi:hypothetical protein KKF34_10165 [Myxococcota bacterium]|nr:hypothetical protein [Myxococcota bacterium]MBU1380421.1 hypothetical protein [Myxococcota bacterium]MBU1497229.1 hypothetical protein [Myxococcota bacterium]